MASTALCQGQLVWNRVQDGFQVWTCAKCNTEIVQINNSMTAFGNGHYRNVDAIKPVVPVTQASETTSSEKPIEHQKKMKAR